MSFEGRYQKLCSCGHYEEQDVYMECKLCTQCGAKYSKSNIVDDTNGNAEGYDYDMVPKKNLFGSSIFDRMTSEELEKAISGECDCGSVIKELEDRLDEAEEVIRFYANGCQVNFDYDDIRETQDSDFDEKDQLFYKGKRARDYLKNKE